MSEPTPFSVVSTIAAKCRRCYHCVRHCPAQAIRVQGGQATVIAERCIGCGRCVRACAQEAKRVLPGVPDAQALLASERPTVAILAPSYPALYRDASPGQVVSAVRRLGFAHVYEVGFGGDMVAREYARLLRTAERHPILSSPCPALVAYIRKHQPELVPHLAPIVSPMVALGRAVKQVYAPGADVVFIGPCIAKKAEHRDPTVAGAVDAVLTFRELTEFLRDEGIEPFSCDESEPDYPLPRFGAALPLAGGLLRAAAIGADILDDQILVIDGETRCISVLQRLRETAPYAVLIDMLLCEGGCIAGPGFPPAAVPYISRHLVTDRVRRLATSEAELESALAEVADVDLSCTFLPEPLPLAWPTEREIREVLIKTNKLTPQDELNCGACGYATCREKAIAVCQGRAELEMCLPYLIEQMQVNIDRLTRSKEEVERARAAATRAQQLASMGELAADVAEEISKPLGSIAAYGHLLREALPSDSALRADAEAIVSEAEQCIDVILGLEGFARVREPNWESVHVASVVERAVAEASARLGDGAIEILREAPDSLPELICDPLQIKNVLVRLLTNSIEAIDGAGTVAISASLAQSGQWLDLRVRDTGRGIPEDLLPRICQPFVTTKTGETAAGLGLPYAHGVVQAHAGEMLFDTKTGRGTTVTVRLPLRQASGPRREAVKVLLIDDDPDILTIHRITLERVGFEIVTAERSDEALEVATREIPDAFVIDLVMEKTDSGARLARALRRDPRFRNAPVIIVTSVVDDIGFEFARNPEEVLQWMRADAWFDKPADPSALAETIHRLLSGSE